MMGVICASNGRVKGTGHQQDKYKLKLMQVSFLLDQFVLGGLHTARNGALAICAIWSSISIQGLEAKTQKNQMYLPKDVPWYHRLDNKAWKAGNIAAFIIHKFVFRFYEDASHIKFVTSNFMCQKISTIKRKSENKRSEFFQYH